MQHADRQPSRALTDSVQFVKGVGPARAADFARLGVHAVLDLLYTFPRRISDRTRFRSVAEARAAPGEEVTLRVRALDSRFRRIGRRTITTVLFEDDTGAIEGVWFNAPWVLDKYEGSEVLLFGKVAERKGRPQIAHPRVEPAEREGFAGETVGHLVPVYPLTGILTQASWLRVMRTALDRYGPLLPEFYPEAFLKKRGLLSRREAVETMHFPKDAPSRERARSRLVYDECLLLQLGLAFRRHQEVDLKPGRAFRIDAAVEGRIRALLPFALTPAQNRALIEIFGDMARPVPMHRLLQGDVGSGKTAVAFAAALAAVANGAQAAVLAPTELLARQHEYVFTAFLSRSSRARVRVALLAGGLKVPERRALRAALAAGAVDILVATHAALEKDIAFKDLGLVVIDEQHKFGVEQRALLCEKGRLPDVLVMTATPIPRSLALTLYGDLDISTIDALPPGRKGVKTALVLPEDRPRIFGFLRREMKNGRQAYIVSPVIAEHEALDLQSAIELFQSLSEGELASFRMGLLHGRMDRSSQRSVMEAFRAGRLDALVSTVVIEVGIDVPNATLLVVYHAERFGLAQLHQLRGRIARGHQRGTCLLLSDAENPAARERLGILARESDGFRIAEEDLRLRGEGEFLGTRQHGRALKLTDI
ncbi:MAG: ATP-dependent DNA helicase RecG, partial [Planctomycetota bacterium]